MAIEERSFGDVGTKCLFENERVRIWEMRLEPGQESALHRHQLDYVLVMIDGDRIAATYEDDTAGSYRGEVEGEVTPGGFVYIPKGGIETARNPGHKAYHEILIELKE
jgi:mannose-6-phosphate isomerase-like protein (cupin superfamily)